jgi:Sulfatase
VRQIAQGRLERIAALSVGPLVLCLTMVVVAAMPGCGGDSSQPSTAATPNILFVIMDDVGVDQMTAFGYGGSTAPNLPNMDTVASAGVRFRNTWSMPECTPGRAAMFLGRYPLRTNAYAALGPYDLANSQVSSDEMTTPKLLERTRKAVPRGVFRKRYVGGYQSRRIVPSKSVWSV